MTVRPVRTMRPGPGQRSGGAGDGSRLGVRMKAAEASRENPARKIFILESPPAGGEHHLRMDPLKMKLAPVDEVMVNWSVIVLPDIFHGRRCGAAGADGIGSRCGDGCVVPPLGIEAVGGDRASTVELSRPDSRPRRIERPEARVNPLPLKE